MVMWLCHQATSACFRSPAHTLAVAGRPETGSPEPVLGPAALWPKEGHPGSPWERHPRGCALPPAAACCPARAFCPRFRRKRPLGPASRRGAPQPAVQRVPASAVCAVGAEGPPAAGEQGRRREGTLSFSRCGSVAGPAAREPCYGVRTVGSCSSFMWKFSSAMS